MNGAIIFQLMMIVVPAVGLYLYLGGWQPLYHASHVNQNEVDQINRWIDNPGLLKEQLTLKCREDAMACFLRSRLSVAEQNWEEASEYLNQVLSVHDDHEGSQQLLLMVNYHQGGEELTLDLESRFKDWLRQHPEDLSVRRLYAKAAFDHELWATAVDHYRYLLSHLDSSDPDYADLMQGFVLADKRLQSGT